LLERAVKLEPNDSGLWYTLGLARATAGNMDAAIDALNHVVSLQGTDDSAHLTLGVAHAIQKNADQASTEFMTVSDGPRKAEAQAGLGFVALMNGNAEEAVRRLGDAVQSGQLPSAGAAQLALGQMHLQRGEFAEAQTALEKAVGADANNREARFFLGLAFRALNREQDALTELQNIADSPGAYAPEAAIQVAEIQLELNAPDKARRALDAAARAGTKNAAYYTVLGRVMMATDDPEGAMQSFETAVRTDKTYAAAYLERGLLHIRREALGPGLADLEQYLKLVGNGGQGTRVAEVRALAEQLRQAGEAPAKTASAAEGKA
jgi:tetratricopeptide (TPR) repeat protein